MCMQKLLRAACPSCGSITVRQHHTSKSTSYGTTLNLPITSFPLRPKHAETNIASKHQDLYNWQKNRVNDYGPTKEHSHARQFVVHDGPPYANGDLHIGHALNKILKDIIVRRKVIEGFIVKWTPGWDCHGLPIEIKALQLQQKEKEASTILAALQSSVSISPCAIRDMARKLAEETVVAQSAQFQQMALCADWKAPYRTMDRAYEVAQLEVFATMVDKELIYRADKPVFWSPSSRTALAEAELEYSEDHISHSVYVAYPLTSTLCHLDDVYLLIWTTTPWTLPANRAIAVNPDMSYSVLTSATDGRKFVVASELVDETIKTIPMLSKLQGIRLCGHNLSGLKYTDIFPGGEKEPRPVLMAEYVSSESGTGLVHNAPGHGQEDYLLCRSQTPPILPFSPVDAAGCYTAQVGHDSLVGLDVQIDGSKRIIELLIATGTLLAVKRYKHKYPYDWRTKKPIIVRSTPQFFADLTTIKAAAVCTLDNVRTVPVSGKSRLRSYVQGRDEWCISRQRSWGVPIPALYNAAGEVLMSRDSIAHIISVFREEGTDAWFQADENTDSWRKWVTPAQQVRGKWTRCQETLDVWFDSGCSWTTLEEQGEAVVADLYLEGSDQHRGWFQSSLLTSVATRNLAPYRTVLTHGFVLDNKGRKMSKSIGNVMDPLLIVRGRKASEPISIDSEVTDTKLRKRLERLSREEATEVKALGADTLRLWVASADYTSDVSISNAILSHVSESVRKFRSTLRYLIGNLQDYDPTKPFVIDEFRAIDSYALEVSARFFDTSNRCFDEYSFNKVVTTLNQYTNTHLSAFYFDTLKDRLYADLKTGSSRLSAQKTLFSILQDYVLILAPICPLLVDEAWSHLPKSLTGGAPHIYASNWYSTRTRSADTQDREDLSSQWRVMMDLRDTVNKKLEFARSSKLIASSLQANLSITISPEQQLPVPDHELANFFIVSKVTVKRDSTEPCVVVDHASSSKCPRCWTYTALTADSLCGRCHQVLDQ